MRKVIEMTGMAFGRWTVTSFAGTDGRGNAMWGCHCECGNEGVVSGNSLRTGKTKSCGCLRRESLLNPRNYQHGHTRNGVESTTYKSWGSMIQRCTNPNATKYSRYGGAGVKVCKRWMTFRGFYLDMKRRPENTTLGRFLDTGDYKKSNCAWMTRAEQETERKRKRSNQSKPCKPTGANHEL